MLFYIVFQVHVSNFASPSDFYLIDAKNETAIKQLEDDML